MVLATGSKKSHGGQGRRNDRHVASCSTHFHEDDHKRYVTSFLTQPKICLKLCLLSILLQQHFLDQVRFVEATHQAPSDSKVAYSTHRVNFERSSSERMQYQNRELFINSPRGRQKSWQGQLFPRNGYRRRRSASQNDEDLSEHLNLDDGRCNLSSVTRASSLAASNKLFLGSDYHNSVEEATNLVERALICSQVDENNYRPWFAKMYKTRSNMHIQQIHILDSDPMIVFPAIDLICSSFNCSTLTVLNITGQQIHDCSRLAHWLSKWPQLAVLDLANTSLSSIESILDLPNFNEPLSSMNSEGKMEDKAFIQRSPNLTNLRVSSDTTSDYANSLSSNRLQTVLRSLTHLLLDYNNINQLNINFIFDRMPNIRHLSLVNNSIYNIYCEEQNRPRLRSQIETMNLANNSINCDKSQMWLLKQFQNPMANIKFPDQEQIRCSSASLADMTWSQRISVLETRICDFCDCRSLKRTAISVDCHNKSLVSLPDVLPLNTKILNLTSNRINSLSVPFRSRNWENVTYVHLEDNLISSFNPLEFSPRFMRNLAALDIRKNKIQEFPSHILEQFIYLDQIHLSDNPWLCDCESTFAFQEWLQRHFHKVGDKEEIRCGISGNEENGLKSNSLQQRLSSRVIYKLSKSELCPQDNLEEPYDWLDVVNIILGVTIVLVIIKVLMDYVYQHRTKRLPHFFRFNV